MERHPELQEPIDLMQIPASRRDAVSIPYSATLFEAWQLLERERTLVLLVLSNRDLPLGVITKEHLEAFYIV